MSRINYSFKDGTTPLNETNLNPILDEINKSAPLTTPAFSGTIKQGGREIGEVRSNYGQIAQIANYTAYSATNRLNAFLTGVFLGNRRWLIKGSGRVFGTTWQDKYYGISLHNIGSILLGDSTFFIQPSGTYIINGKWSRYNASGNHSYNGGGDPVGYGTCLEICGPREIYHSALIPARMYTTTSNSVGGWTDKSIFIDNHLFEFEVVVTAAKD